MRQSCMRLAAKWILLEFAASTDRRYFFEIGAEPRGEVLAVRKDKTIEVDTGSMTVTLDEQTGRLFDRVVVRGKNLLDQSSAPLILSLNDDGRSAPTRIRSRTGRTAKRRLAGSWAAGSNGRPTRDADSACA